MADSKLKLPGDFQAGKVYVLEGKTLIAWREALISDRALPGTGLREHAIPGHGRFLEVVPVPSPTLCPFHGYLYDRGVMRIDCGRLIKTAATGELVSITGMSADIELTTSLKVQLAVTMDSGFAVTGATIGRSADWVTDAATFTGDFPDEYQTSAVIRVGEVSSGELPKNTPGFEFSLDGEDGLFHFEQYLHTHLYMALVAYDGKAALFPLAWSG